MSRCHRLNHGPLTSPKRQRALREPRQECRSEWVLNVQRNQGTEEAGLPEAPRRTPSVGIRRWPHGPDVCRASCAGQAPRMPSGAGRPTELCPGPSRGGLVKEGGRKEEAGGRVRLPLDRGNREAGCSGPVAGSDLWPKQTCLRGLEGLSLPVRMESKANRNPRGSSCDP